MIHGFTNIEGEFRVYLGHNGIIPTKKEVDEYTKVIKK